MITTRKGREGPPVVTYNGYYGIQQNIRRMELMDPYGFVKYQVERDSSLADPPISPTAKTLLKITGTCPASISRTRSSSTPYAEPLHLH